MFLKLLKTDFNRCSRDLVLVVIKIVAVSFMLILANNEFASILKLFKINYNVIVAQYMVTLCVLTFFVLIKRFCEKFISTESYLSFLLPVKRYQHLASAWIISVFWSFLILVLLILLVVLYFKISINIINIIYFLSLLFFALSITSLWLILTYLCILVVHISKFKIYPKLFGVILFSVILYITFIVTSCIQKWLIHNMFDMNNCLYYGYSIVSLGVSINDCDINYIIMGIELFVVATLCYCGCVYILNNKLDVD